MTTRVAVAQWARHDGTVSEICEELAILGYLPEPFLSEERVPAGADVVFTVGPIGPWVQIPEQIAAMRKGRRPVLVHYSTENPPDPRIPSPLVLTLARFRSWVGRMGRSPRGAGRVLVKIVPLLWGRRPLGRLRNVGDYRYACRRGGADLFVSYSEIYAQSWASYGLPAIFVPWGTARSQYADLNLERDIDVLWMGVQRNGRRRRGIELVRARMDACGKHLYVADGEENPLIFGEARTRLLNRTKIVLNIEHSAFGDVLIRRFFMVAGNRCLVVSEPEPPHCQRIVAGEHYVISDRASLAETVLYYLEHEDERRLIAENAYRLATTELTFTKTIQGVMAAVERIREPK